MTTAANTALTDVTSIAPGSSHDIPFVLTAAGQVAVASVPHPVPRKNQTETGALGRVRLIRPGSPPTVALSRRFVIGSKSMVATYDATASDVVTGSKGICRIFNDTLFPIQFNTTLTIPPTLTASFSVDLLNAMLALAARTADLRLHLQTSVDGSPASVASWSIALARNLPAGPVTIRSDLPPVALKDRVELRFPLTPLDAFSVGLPVVGDVTLADGRIGHCDSLAGLSLALDGQNGIVATLAFDAANIDLEVTAHLTDLEVTNVRFQVFQVELTVDFDGRVTVDGQVAASATIAGNFVDLGDRIRGVLLQKIAQGLPQQLRDAAAVKRAIFRFIANLMRLNDVVIETSKTRTHATGQILDLAFVGRALVASYFLVPSSQSEP